MEFMAGLSIAECMQQFITAIDQVPFGNCLFLPAKALVVESTGLAAGTDVWIGVNAIGVHVFEADPYRYRLGILHSEIVSCSFTDTSCMLETSVAEQSGCLKLKTDNGKSIIAAIRMHENDLLLLSERAIMVSTAVEQRDEINGPLISSRDRKSVV